MSEIDNIRIKLKQFAQVRDWAQFHSPKNLSMALSAEVGELLEVFQWLTEEQSRNLTEDQHKAAEEEVADVFLYLLRLASELNIDLLEAAKKKMLINEQKYPAAKVKGSSKKYTEY